MDFSFDYGGWGDPGFFQANVFYDTGWDNNNYVSDFISYNQDYTSGPTYSPPSPPIYQPAPDPTPVPHVPLPPTPPPPPNPTPPPPDVPSYEDGTEDGGFEADNAEDTHEGHGGKQHQPRNRIATKIFRGKLKGAVHPSGPTSSKLQQQRRPLPQPARNDSHTTVTTVPVQQQLQPEQIDNNRDLQTKVSTPNVVRAVSASATPTTDPKQQQQAQSKSNYVVATSEQPASVTQPDEFKATLRLAWVAVLLNLPIGLIALCLVYRARSHSSKSEKSRADNYDIASMVMSIFGIVFAVSIVFCCGLVFGLMNRNPMTSSSTPSTTRPPSFGYFVHVLTTSEVTNTSLTTAVANITTATTATIRIG